MSKGHITPPNQPSPAPARLGPRRPYAKRQAVRHLEAGDEPAFGVTHISTDVEVTAAGLERAVNVKAAPGCRRAQLGLDCHPACRALKPLVSRYTSHPYEGRPAEDELHLTPFTCAYWNGRRRAEVPLQYLRRWRCTSSALAAITWAALIRPQAEVARMFGTDRAKVDDAAFAARSALKRHYVPHVPASGMIGLDGKHIPGGIHAVFADIKCKRAIAVVRGRPATAFRKVATRIKGIERLRVIVIDGDSKLRKEIQERTSWVMIVYDLFHHTRRLNNELCAYLKANRPPKPEGVKRPKRGLARTIRMRWDKLKPSDQAYLSAIFRLAPRLAQAYWYRETNLTILELDSEREDVAAWLIDWAIHPPRGLATVFRASRLRCRRTWHCEITNISLSRTLLGIEHTPTNGFIEGGINRFFEDRQRAGCGHTAPGGIGVAALCRFRAISPSEFSQLMLGVARRQRRSTLRARRRYRQRRLMEAAHA